MHDSQLQAKHLLYSSSKPFPKKHSATDCISYQSWGLKYDIESELRKKLFASLADQRQTIEDTVRIFWQSRSLKARLKQKAKNFILLMPRPVVAFFKGMM